MSARRHLAQQRDAPENGENLGDLFVEPLAERFEEIPSLLDEPKGYVDVPFANAIDDRGNAIAVACARGLGGRDEIVRDARKRGDDDDRIQLAPLGNDVDRIRDALRIADRGAAEFDDNHAPPPGQWISGLVISRSGGTGSASVSRSERRVTVAERLRPDPLIH